MNGRTSVDHYTYVCWTSAITVNLNVVILTVDKGAEHLRDSSQAGLRVLGDEATGKWEMDGRQRREADGRSRRRRADVDALEEVLERDRRQLDTDLRRL